VHKIVASLLVSGAVLFAGCSSDPAYGINRDPALLGLEGREDGTQVREGIKKENERAMEQGDEPIFQTDDRY